jgi:hypothetical protein
MTVAALQLADFNLIAAPLEVPLIQDKIIPL